MAALDLFGRRWSLRILWELSGGPLRARRKALERQGVVAGQPRRGGETVRFGHTSPPIPRHPTTPFPPGRDHLG
ncbi:transcriptional regulator, partial [Kitasatospora sp. NPDC058263]